jgi:hypothetical protein
VQAIAHIQLSHLHSTPKSGNRLPQGLDGEAELLVKLVDPYELVPIDLLHAFVLAVRIRVSILIAFHDVYFPEEVLFVDGVADMVKEGKLVLREVPQLENT